jgi:hypothetical protein
VQNDHAESITHRIVDELQRPLAIRIRRCQEILKLLSHTQREQYSIHARHFASASSEEARSRERQRKRARYEREREKKRKKRETPREAAREIWGRRKPQSTPHPHSSAHLVVQLKVRDPQLHILVRGSQSSHQLAHCADDDTVLRAAT